jgi:MFS family permease
VRHRQSGFRQAFGSLAHRDYRHFASAQLFNSLGTQLIQTVVFWQVFELTGSALSLGLTGIARAVPHVILSAVGGVLADRLNRVQLIQAGQILNAIVLLVLAALTISGTAGLWQLYVITALNSAASAITQPSRTALIPSLVPRERLVNAVALNTTLAQTSQITGPALAGIGIVTLGIGTAYVLNALFYIVAAISIIGIHTSKPISITKGNPWESFAEGLQFVRSKPVIISLLALDLAAVVLGSYRALLPILAEALGAGAAGYGWLSTAPGIGSLIGAGIILTLADMRYKGLYTVFGVLAYSATLALLGLSFSFYVAFLAAMLLGVTNSIQVIPRNSVILGIAPDALRGRVEAFRTMLSGGGPPLGYALSGGVAAIFGAQLALVIGAISCAVVVVGIGVSHRKLWDPNLGAFEEPRG